ncbi:MAG TPA: serine hydrolase domain-containing protein, partial [Gammaproteobacteria bacterium]|nr:serine hydrolase domain-containing protein [Gammaproteobacteria bacterium]
MSIRKFNSVLLGAWLAVVPALASHAETATPQSVGLSADRLQRVHELVERTMAAGEISGAVTLVARNGQVAYLEAQGVMDLASKKPMQPDSMFRMASMSKPVAAVAILMLAEEGKVRLNDPVSRFIPAYANLEVGIAKPVPPGPAPAAQAGPGGAPPAFYKAPAERQITVLDLLTHTSGFMSGPMGNSVANAAFNKRHELGLKWVEELGPSPLEFQPGTRWAYSAVAGFDALAHIVEVAAGQEYSAFLRERLFGPLGMRDVT